MGHCFWFGHAPHHATLEDDCLHERYRCWRCGKLAVWDRALLPQVIRLRTKVMQKRGMTTQDLADGWKDRP